jgi:DNA-binding transcriptional regulator YiaG
MQTTIHKYKKAALGKKETKGDRMAKKPLRIRYAEIRALRRKLLETERFYAGLLNTTRTSQH